MLPPPDCPPPWLLPPWFPLPWFPPPPWSLPPLEVPDDVSDLEVEVLPTPPELRFSMKTASSTRTPTARIAMIPTDRLPPESLEVEMTSAINPPIIGGADTAALGA